MQSPDEIHLFRQTGENCRTLYEIATVNDFKVTQVLLKEQKRWENPSLQHLEAFFDSRPATNPNG